MHVHVHVYTLYTVYYNIRNMPDLMGWEQAAHVPCLADSLAATAGVSCWVPGGGTGAVCVREEEGEREGERVDEREGGGKGGWERGRGGGGGGGGMCNIVNMELPKTQN